MKVTINLKQMFWFKFEIIVLYKNNFCLKMLQSQLQ